MTKFRLRFNNHKSRLRSHPRLAPGDRKSDDFIYRHFFTAGHKGLDDISIRIIDKVDNEELVWNRRAYRLRTVGPEGLNENDFFFYSQNHRSRTRSNRFVAASQCHGVYYMSQHC